MKSPLILFLDKMVNTILSCESFAGRRWRREMYGLTFLRLRRWLLKQQPNKTVKTVLLKTSISHLR